MVERSRDWLKSFLRLDARSSVMTVSPGDIARQEDTVLRAVQMLDEQPGVILADEVGMGKTFEALGVIAARHREDPSRRTLVLTPGPDLNQKWHKEFTAFCGRRSMYDGFKDKFASTTRLRELLACAKTHPITIAPVSMFAGGRAMRDNAYLLSLFFHWKGLRGNQSAAAFRHYRQGTLSTVDVTQAEFYDDVPWERVSEVVDAVMTGAKRAPADLDKLYDERGRSYELFADTDRIDRALAQIRFRLLGALLPDFDLLVVDEAHKLKNPGALRATAVREAFYKKFDKAIFLTATPFQLDVAELRQVLDLFSLARTAPSSLRAQADELLAHVRDYQAAYLDFESVWRRLDGVGASDFKVLHHTDPLLGAPTDDPTLVPIVARAKKLLELKRSHIEPGFRKWMIRSLREDKRDYRNPKRARLPPEGGARVPFLLYERFIAELFRSKSRTHKAAVQINMVSSYGAARVGAILSDELKTGLADDAEAYRQLLRSVLDGLRDEHGTHPKLTYVLQDALEAAARGEKTLIFCARIETLNELSRQLRAAWTAALVDRWKAVDPGATEQTVFDTHEKDETRKRGRHSRFASRLHRSHDVLFLALRERYLQSIQLDSFARDNAGEIARLASEVAGQQRVVESRATRFDWALAKRSIEHTTAILARERGHTVEDHETFETLTSERFVTSGYNLVADELEYDEVGAHAPVWSITADHVREVARGSGNLWTYLRGYLSGVSPDLRVRMVERIARYLTHSEVPFLVDVLCAARAAQLDVEAIESAAMLRFMDEFWTSEGGRSWVARLKGFLQYAVELDDGRQAELLDGLKSAGQFVRHTADNESREKLREAFNTPLFPMVLVANEVMQEGLDLHQQCARVVHHDLAWNPAQLEQRVGRVDRLGGLIQRNRAKRPESTLDILYPLVTRTIDERLDRVVRAREKWLEFLLGAAPNLADYDLNDDPIPDLPEEFAEALRIDLGPDVRRAAPKSGGIAAQ